MKVKLVVKHPDVFAVILKLIDFRNYSAVVYLFVIARNDSDEAISVLLLGINSTTPRLPRSFGARNDVFH